HTVVTGDIRKILALVPKGSVFGELSLFSFEPRSADAVALEDSLLLGLRSDDFELLLEKEPQLGLRILQFITILISDRLRNTNDMLHQSLEWALNVSGAINFHLDELSSRHVLLEIDLLSGQHITGRLLKTDQHLGGHVFLIETDQGKIQVIPYHAIASFAFERDSVDLKPQLDMF
ncbi:MAG: cyclic nucleotide-binding domain-containing protein, partial [Lentisphaerae bacterium]